MANVELLLKHAAPGVRVEAIAVPWAGDAGLYLFDQFGGHPPFELELPPALRAGALPPLPEVLVDAASVCATSRTTATSISGDDLVEAEDALFAADYWVQTSLDGVPILAIKITVGDGAFPLYLAKSATGESVGWMLELGLINDYSPTAGLPAP